MRTQAENVSPLAKLVSLAETLDLTALAQALPRLLDAAEQKSPSYSDFGLSMLEAEAQARTERKLRRSLKRSGLGTVEGLDGFDFAARPQLEPRVVKELAAGRFIDEKRHVICVGRPGLGKTRIAKAIAHAACLRGRSVLFTLTADMLEDLHASLADGTFKRRLRHYTKPDLLVWDEFGYQPFDSRLASYLFRLVSLRHGQGSIILTASSGFTHWSSFFPSEGQAVATVDRLVDRATILRFTGKGFRTPKDVYGAADDN